MAKFEARDIFRQGNSGFRLSPFRSPGGAGHPVAAGATYYGGEVGSLYVMVHEDDAGAVVLSELSQLTGAQLGRCKLEPEQGVGSAFAGLAIPSAPGADGAVAPLALVAPTGWRFSLNRDGSAYLGRPRAAGAML